MPPSPSTPVGLTKAVTSKAEKAKSATQKRTTILPCIPYELPYNWAGVDQVVAAVLGCQTMGDFSEFCRGKGTADPALYWAVYWTFQEFLIGKTLKLMPQQLPNAVAQFFGNPAHLRLITDQPSVPITPQQMDDPNNPQYQQAGELDKAVFQINTVKLLHFMLLHLDDHLNGRGTTANHYGGHEMRDWVLVYMVFSRIQTETRKRRSKKPDFSSEDFYKIQPQGKNAPPHFKLILPNATEDLAATDAATAAEQQESESDDDIERPCGPNHELFGEQHGVEFTKSHIEAQEIVVQKFIGKGDKEEAELSIDSKNRVKNVRPSIKQRQIDKLIARCMEHVEIISDGLHAKMTDAPQTNAHATQVMNRLAATDKVPEVDSEWLQTGDSQAFNGLGGKNDAELRADWLAFQEMVAGGYVENDMAVGYVEACQNMRLDPNDPSWEINGGKCKLHPWQVIGADWIRRANREGGISPLLADDCGLGKTIQTLAALYADYLDAKAGIIAPPYRPSLIVAPGIISINWVNDNAQLLRNGLSMWLWQGRQADAGSSVTVPKQKILDKTDLEMKQWIDGLDKNNPETMRQVIVTTYGTGPIRSLYVNGRRVHDVAKERSDEKARQAKARLDEQARFLRTDINDMDDMDDDAGEQAGTAEMPEKPEDVWACSLTERFYRVCCDESHKAKSTRTNTFRWVQELRPTNGYIFLSATPMPNTIEDMKCYLVLNWKDEWASEDIDPKFPMAAIGIWSLDTRSDPTDPNCLFPTQDCKITPTKAHLNPKLFRACITPEGSMDGRVAAILLPAIQAQLSMRRTMSSVVSWEDTDGTKHSVRVGEEVPPFECKTIEVAFKEAYNYKRYEGYHQALAEELSDSHGATQGPHLDSGKVGKRNMAFHKRLQVLSASIHAERFTQSYQAQSVKTGVEEMNTLHEWGNDRGLSTFYAHATLDPNGAIPSSRIDLAEWLLRGSPKLCWLVDFVNGKRKIGKRVAVFVVWPVCQWLIEATFELLGFKFVSIRSEKTLKLRQEAINTFCNLEIQCDGCVMSYACAGTGLNYQKATHYMIHIEIPLNLATWFQGNGRVHRLGQLFKQEIYTLCMDGSYDLTLLANACHKYHPEMRAVLNIPDDAQINGKARPAASLAAERAEFDNEYGHRVIADMLGLREPETNRDLMHPPRRQFRQDVNDTLWNALQQYPGADRVVGVDPLPSVPDSKKQSRKRKALDSPAARPSKRAAQDQNSSPLAGKGRPEHAPKPAPKQAKKPRGPKRGTRLHPLSKDTITDDDADSDGDQLMGGVDNSQFPSFPSQESDADSFKSCAADPAGDTSQVARPNPTPAWMTNPAPVAGHGLAHLFSKPGPSTTGSSVHLDDHQNTQHPGSPGLTPMQAEDPQTPVRQGPPQTPSDIAQGSSQRRLSTIIGPDTTPLSPHASPAEQLGAEQLRIREQRASLRKQKETLAGLGANGDDAEAQKSAEKSARKEARKEARKAKEARREAREARKAKEASEAKKQAKEAVEGGGNESSEL